jgi:hypothetical protein
VYVVIYLILKNLNIMGYLRGLYDALFTTLIVLFIADIAVMGYLYRNYFGRSITHELSDDSNTRYNSETHTYEPIPLKDKLTTNLHEHDLNQKFNACRDILDQQIKEQAELIKLENKEMSEKKKNAEIILNEKNRQRAAKCIQQWWRNLLYRQPDGIFYLRAKQHFEEIKEKFDS